MLLRVLEQILPERLPCIVGLHKFYYILFHNQGTRSPGLYMSREYAHILLVINLQCNFCCQKEFVYEQYRIG